MATEWMKAPPEVLEIAEELIGKYHDSLVEANIAFLFRDKAPASNGRITLGQAKKVSPDTQMLMPVKYHFLIWLAEDMWQSLDHKQRMALVDHELSHCFFDGAGNASIVKHDIEEFNTVIERWGFWWPGAQATARAISQAPLPMNGLRQQGRRDAIEPEAVACLEN